MRIQSNKTIHHTMNNILLVHGPWTIHYFLQPGQI